MMQSGGMVQQQPGGVMAGQQQPGGVQGAAGGMMGAQGGQQQAVGAGGTRVGPQQQREKQMIWKGKFCKNLVILKQNLFHLQQIAMTIFSKV